MSYIEPKNRDVVRAKACRGMLENINMLTPEGRLQWADIVAYGKKDFLGGLDLHEPENIPREPVNIVGWRPSKDDGKNWYIYKNWLFDVAKTKRSNELKLYSLLRAMQIYAEHKNREAFKFIAMFLIERWGIEKPSKIYDGDIVKFASEFTGATR